MILSRLLEELLQTHEVPEWSHDIEFTGPSGHALRRLVSATQSGISGLDWAVLVRQCLRRLPDDTLVRTHRLGEAEQALLSDVDVTQALDGVVTAKPYAPNWVIDLGNEALDFPRARVVVAERPIAAEPWLNRLFGMQQWKSAAQRDVTWHSLNAPHNSTFLIGLPTGAGKSLVYQCCAAFEYSSSLTVLVVPTVALGIDQLAAVNEFPGSATWGPQLYTPGESAQAVLDSVKSGRCRLLIAAPEAIVSGRLGGMLRDHAKSGFLRRLVIDEAHLIESWGADFRVDFQLLSATLKEWRSVAPSGIRALLLSATFAPSTPAMLRELFADAGVAWEQHVVQQLRPEMHYFSVPQLVSADDQTKLVSHALRRLPRPAILYVTEIRDALAWEKRLQDAGYKRFRVFHGNTASVERKEIMKAWRGDQLDLVVGTSAFGMGVDKADVRAVVHACYPEGIDRFYQEVGRGGRDGQPCISLLVPNPRDTHIARNMGPTLLTDPEKVSGRWQAMWQSRDPVLDSEGRQTASFRIRTCVQPHYRFGNASFGENTRWNKRLLLMMNRAQLIRIESIGRDQSRDEVEPTEFAIIRPCFMTLDTAERVAEMLAEPRRVELAAINRSMSGLDQYFKRRLPICKALRAHYGPTTSRACGSCGFCRNKLDSPANIKPLVLEKEIVFTKPTVHLVQVPGLGDHAERSTLVQALRQVLHSRRIDRFAVASKHRKAFEDLLDRADDVRKSPYRIDEFNSSHVPELGPSESMLVIHVDEIDKHAEALNSRGKWIVHWLLGGTIEQSPGRWAFMHDFCSRPYPGRSGISQWLYDLKPTGDF
jgi:ATP-dependent DNA helicase RecQ